MAHRADVSPVTFENSPIVNIDAKAPVQAPSRGPSRARIRARLQPKASPKGRVKFKFLSSPSRPDDAADPGRAGETDDRAGDVAGSGLRASPMTG